MPVYCELMEGGIEPKKNHMGDGGYDIFLPHDIVIEPWKSLKVYSKVKILVPIGYTGLMRPRSSAYSDDINTNGTIDHYTGEIKLKFANLSDKIFKAERGDALSQMIPAFTCAGLDENSLKDKGIEFLINILTATQLLVRVDKLPETDRGDKGFGSSGNTGTVSAEDGDK